MSRQDPGATTGQMPYELSRCTCGCLSSLHKLTDAGERATCSNSNCGCRRFTEAVSA
ncbi:hypothetical protein [Actinoplanes sp. NPDC049118]|uniref:hypothetical protein n=1 Tax=Actinoplanes sp. NPDC049118 TaxID=3155769 RepID=UPI0033F13C20